MLESVLVFVLLLSAFEFVLISSIAPRYRLRLLGSRALTQCAHFGMFGLNLWMHWGTVTGMMSATGAFVTSIFTFAIARLMYGEIRNNVRVRRGIFGFKNQELVL